MAFHGGEGLYGTINLHEDAIHHITPPWNRAVSFSRSRVPTLPIFQQETNNFEQYVLMMHVHRDTTPPQLKDFF